MRFRGVGEGGRGVPGRAVSATRRAGVTEVRAYFSSPDAPRP